MSLAISVVVPTYNRAGLIGETLERILAQSLPAAEIIVVDDGSTDGTEAVVAAYAPRVRYHAQKNAGAPVARNTGVFLATAPWVAFCDDDDLWMPDHLEKLAGIVAVAPDIRFAFSNAREWVEGVAAEASRFDLAPKDFWRSGQRAGAPDSLLIRPPLYKYALRFQPVAASAMMVSRDYCNQIDGFDPALRYLPGEEVDFILRCLRRGPVGVITAPTVLVRTTAEEAAQSAATQPVVPEVVVQRMIAEVCLLAHAYRTHGVEAEWRGLVRAEALRRAVAALEAAFGIGMLSTVSLLAGIAAVQPLTLKQRMEVLVAGLPAPLAAFFHRRLVGGRSDLPLPTPLRGALAIALTGLKASR